MNCHIASIDVRNSRVTSALVNVDRFTLVALRSNMKMALHHCPGEGSGES